MYEAPDVEQALAAVQVLAVEQVPADVPATAAASLLVLLEAKTTAAVRPPATLTAAAAAAAAADHCVPAQQTAVPVFPAVAAAVAGLLPVVQALAAVPAAGLADVQRLTSPVLAAVPKPAAVTATAGAPGTDTGSKQMAAQLKSEHVDQQDWSLQLTLAA